MNSKLLDKLLIGSNLYRNKSINNLADLLDEAAVEIQKLNVRLTFAQSYKADAEQYKELQKVLCPIEGLSIRLEYRDGDITFCNSRSFSIIEVKNLFTLRQQIRWSANFLWDGIEKAINDEAIDQAINESKLTKGVTHE